MPCPADTTIIEEKGGMGMGYGTMEEKLAALIVQMKRELAELKAAQEAGAPSRH